MELTDAGPLTIVSIVAVVLFALIVLGWPRFAHPVVALATRAVQVLLLNVVVVLLALMVLNNQYVFYATWGDLIGNASPQVQAEHGGTVARALSAPVRDIGLPRRPAGMTDYVLPQPGQRLQAYSVRDPFSGTDVPVLVYLPAGYDAHSTRRYPVIIGLHGFPSTPMSFVNHNFVSTADRLTAEHKLAPSIFVIPRIDVPAEIDTECVNGPPGRPQTDTWLARVVPGWTMAHLRVRTERTSWATMGYSYGGWCSAVLSMRHPGIFGAAIILQGYFRPWFVRAYAPFTPAQLHSFDLVHTAGANPPPLNVWVLASRHDHGSYPSTSAFLRAARAPLSIHSVVLAEGGHRPSVYEPYSASALTWLATTMPGFRPGSR